MMRNAGIVAAAALLCSAALTHANPGPFGPAQAASAPLPAPAPSQRIDRDVGGAGAFAAPVAMDAVVYQPAPASAPVQVAQWTVTSADRNVRKVLERWSRVAQQQLVYDVDKDIELRAEDAYAGTFEEALGRLLLGLELSDLPLRACLYSNSVIRIVRRNHACK